MYGTANFHDDIREPAGLCTLDLTEIHTYTT